MALHGSTIVVRGEVHSGEDLVIEGRVEGPIWNDGSAVTIAADAMVAGDIVAREIRILGTVDGTLIASDAIQLQPTARVSGRVLASAFSLSEGAVFNGTVQPQNLDSALSVARHRHQARDDAE